MYSRVSCTERSSESKMRISLACDSFMSELSMAANTGEAAARTARCAGNLRIFVLPISASSPPHLSSQTTSTSEKSRSHQSCCVIRWECMTLWAGDVGGSLMIKRMACTTRWFSSPWLHTKVNRHKWLRRDMLIAWACHSCVCCASHVESFCHASPTRASKESLPTPMPSPRSFHSTLDSTCPWSNSNSKAWSRTCPGGEAQYSTDLVSTRWEASWFM
mmetsp:Transcript_63739/g.137090  ORF Transcript_63739/g.137090 Transcript_63739/m.137090 type:complete len:218 (+) Transcript_63739:316-969(+)